jgi:NTE family protein
MMRLARFAASRPVGLALGGGGPLAVTQLGAIQAIRESGLRLDMLAGTGIGAHLAVGLALGWDPGTARERALEAAEAALPSRRSAAGGGASLERCLSDQFGELQLEDSWLPVLVVVADLARARPRVLSYGAIREVLLASLSCPGAAEPVRRGKALLVDGGYVSDEPLRALREAGVERIITVDLAARFAESDLDGVAGAPVPASMMALLRRAGAARRASDLSLRVAVTGDPLARPRDAAARIEQARQRALPRVEAWCGSDVKAVDE